MTPESMPHAAGRSELLHGGFTAIPNLVLLRTDISPMAKVLYAIMLDVIQYQRAEPTAEELQELLQCGEHTLRKAKAELVDLKLLEVRRRGQGKPNEYTLLEPEPILIRENRESRDAEPGVLSISSKDFKIEDKSAATPKRRDELWDTLVELFGAAPAGGERGRWNKACQWLRQSGATPDLLRIAAKNYRTLPSYRECSMTPTALATNWTILTATPKTAVELQLEQSHAKARAAGARYG